MDDMQADRTPEPTPTVPARIENGYVAANWAPSPEMFRWAAAKVPGLDVERSSRRFRDWHARQQPQRWLSNIPESWQKWLLKDYAALSPEERAVAARWEAHRQAEHYEYLKGIAKMHREQGIDYPEPEPPAALLSVRNKPKELIGHELQH